MPLYFRNRRVLWGNGSWLVNEYFKNPSHNHITSYHAVKELLSSKRVSHVKDIRYTEASYKTTLFYFHTELFIRLNALFSVITCSCPGKGRKEASSFKTWNFNLHLILNRKWEDIGYLLKLQVSAPHLNNRLPPSSTDHGPRVRRKEISLIADPPGYKRRNIINISGIHPFISKEIIPQKLGGKKLNYIILFRNMVPDKVFVFIFL